RNTQRVLADIRSSLRREGPQRRTSPSPPRPDGRSGPTSAVRAGIGSRTCRSRTEMPISPRAESSRPQGATAAVPSTGRRGGARRVGRTRHSGAMTPETGSAPTTPLAVPDDVPEQPPVGARCFGDGDPLYEKYHDTEWGVPVHGDTALFERLALEGFQSGLSWITVLRKRPAFREVFAGFDPEVVAGFGEQDVDRLLGDARIIR